MKQVIESAKKFNSELKKSINVAIVGAFGLIIALAWKDVITEYMDKIAGFSPVQGKVVSALIITIISVLGIMIVTKLVQEKEPEKKEEPK
ncbi:MAG: DUF5654 family protein [Nanoarchaeota archaeon]